jgi:hypothetical protein
MTNFAEANAIVESIISPFNNDYVRLYTSVCKLRDDLGWDTEEDGIQVRIKARSDVSQSWDTWKDDFELEYLMWDEILLDPKEIEIVSVKKRIYENVQEAFYNVRRLLNDNSEYIQDYSYTSDTYAKVKEESAFYNIIYDALEDILKKNK